MTLQQDYTLQDGKYRILKVLGQGGFGITYLAIQVRLDRKVAIKEFFMKNFCERNETTRQVTLGTAGSCETVNSCREKFWKEAKHIAKLEHPNIIRIIDVFDENSTSYYVMDYIEGGSLENKLGIAGLSMSDATRYILQVAETLKYIHKKNIAHLDIKPSNIMLNGNDEILLIDFGVSKQYDFSTGEQTSVFPVAISSGYTPLEQYDPNGVKEFSPKPDIYSLGATYFKLLTGITPLKASEITKDFLQENLKAKGVPTAVISIICKSMEKLQENRFSDVSSFIEGLNSISLLVDDSSDKKNGNIAYKQYEEGTAVMPSQEEIDTWVKNVISGEYNTGRYETAFEHFSEYAKMGNATVQYYLGEMYYNGEGVSKDYTKAVEWYRKSAEQGHAGAQYNLGRMYENGRGVSQDYAKAAEWYRKSAEQEDADAQYNLGKMYYNGRGVSQDNAKAVEWYRKSAERGNADAQCNLGYMYSNGLGVSQDKVKAVEWYRKSAEQGNAVAQYNLGIMYEKGKGVSKDYVKAVEWYRKSAEQGKADAQCNLGYMYDNGMGVSQDNAKAAEWYRKSAEQGNASAQYNLGIMYENGRGVSQDYAKAAEWYRKSAEQGDTRAVEWYRKSAEQGNVTAQYNLGYMYHDGRGVSRDHAKAVEWYRKSAEQGNADAQYALGYMYENGRGVSQDHAKAVEWYQKAAEQDHGGAQCQLGGMYLYRKDYTKAVKWLLRVAMRGNPDAQLQLGIMFKKGLGVYPNFDEAERWFRESANQGNHWAANELKEMLSVGPVKWCQEIAEQGNAYAQYKLGDMYRNGVVVFQNNFKAVEWYRKSAEQGNTDAQYELGYMYHNGIGVSKDHTKAAEWYSKAANGGDVRARKVLASSMFKFKTFITKIFN